MSVNKKITHSLIQEGVGSPTMQVSPQRMNDTFGKALPVPVMQKIPMPAVAPAQPASTPAVATTQTTKTGN